MIVSGQAVDNTLQLNQSGGGRIDIPLPESEPSGFDVYLMLKYGRVCTMLTEYLSNTFTTQYRYSFGNGTYVYFVNNLLNDDEFFIHSNPSPGYIEFTSENRYRLIKDVDYAITGNFNATPIGFPNGKLKVHNVALADYNMTSISNLMPISVVLTIEDSVIVKASISASGYSISGSSMQVYPTIHSYTEIIE